MCPTCRQPAELVGNTGMRRCTTHGNLAYPRPRARAAARAVPARRARLRVVTGRAA